jgi:high-affinity iron transporter
MVIICITKLESFSMFSTLLITFREGLEAFLMVAIATLYLRKTNRLALINAVRVGLAVALGLSIALGLALAKMGESSPAWEGALALVAAIAVIWCVAHMRKAGKHMGGEISSGIGKATLLDGSRAWWAVFGFTLFMVGREGVESATMLASLAGGSEMRALFVGGVIGLCAAATVAILWVRFGRQVNLSRFFNVTAVFMLAFASLLLLKGVFEFTEVNLMPGLDNAYWHALIEPIVEGDFAQLMSLILVLAPTLWLVSAHFLDQKRGLNSVA